VVKEAVASWTERKAEKKNSKKRNKIHTLLKISEVVANTLYEIGAIDEESLKTVLKQVKK